MLKKIKWQNLITTRTTDKREQSLTLQNSGRLGQAYIGKQFDLTFSECNKLIETLIDAKEAARTSKRLDMDRTSQAHVGFMEVVSEMHQNK